MQGQHLSVDGSFVEANAAKESRIPRERVADGLLISIRAQSPTLTHWPPEQNSRSRILERGFKDTEEIVLKMSSLYEGTIGELKYIGGDDYEVALDWIRRTKCAFIEKYEHEFKQKWDGPRPKDCSRKDW